MLEEKLFPLQQLLFPFEPELSGLEEKLFRLQHLLCPFKPGLSGLEEMLFPLQHLLFPFEPELSGLEEKLFRLQAPRDSLKRMRSGMKPEAFRLPSRLQSEEHGFRRRPHPKEDRPCPARGIVPQRFPAAIRMVSHSKPGYLVLQPADEPAWGLNRARRGGDAEL